MHVRNPVEWGVDQIRVASSAIGARSHARPTTQPAIRRIGFDDLWVALRRGMEDFAASRSDVVLLCVIYPVAGLVMARLAFGYGLLPLVFPLASGFALIAPVAAVGLYEMSRRRETGRSNGWADALAVTRSPGFGSIMLFGLLLMAIFLAWLGVALMIYDRTLGPDAPVSLAAFAHDLFATQAGWTLIAVGMGVGFVFALGVFAISVVSVPLLLERDTGLGMAIGTSLRAITANPGPLALWGGVIAASLLLGSVPFLLGLIVVMPVLGHATWHLYRRLVVPEGTPS
ncbi:MAG: DUF2189 domain-containing protein [Alphaproteobacteria bacterium]|nr:DUF2189 domain-containing protein [Alphaproteobacteria bacterium]